MEKIIKHILIILMLFFGVRQYLRYDDLYCSIFLLLISLAIITAKTKS